MAFLPSEEDWLTGHFYDVPNQTRDFCGDLSGIRLLNVGCGEMLTDFGLLNLNVSSIVGLDLHEKPSDHLSFTAKKLTDKGFTIPDDYAERLSWMAYDGLNFPFDDSSFDFVFSWSAFEHIRDVPQVLNEMRRVATPDARLFIQVFPWYHCFYGSHLTDYIAEPYFHLSRSDDWVASQLGEYLKNHPDQREFIMNMKFPDYQSLNRYSANQFFSDVRKAGFAVSKAEAIVYQQDLSAAPEGVPFSDLMICGSKMLLRKI